jgi:hypothetical protein
VGLGHDGFLHENGHGYASVRLVTLAR